MRASAGLKAPRQVALLAFTRRSLCPLLSLFLPPLSLSLSLSSTAPIYGIIYSALVHSHFVPREAHRRFSLSVLCLRSSVSLLPLFRPFSLSMNNEPQGFSNRYPKPWPLFLYLYLRRYLARWESVSKGRKSMDAYLEVLKRDFPLGIMRWRSADCNAIEFERGGAIFQKYIYSCCSVPRRR